MWKYIILDYITIRLNLTSLNNLIHATRNIRNGIRYASQLSREEIVRYLFYKQGIGWERDC